MPKINPKKVFTEYRNGVTLTSPIARRHYTLTHSDTTGDLFVVVATDYAKDQLSSMHDEVLLEWRIEHAQPYLYGEVLVDGPQVPGNPAIRNAIFIKEIPTALQAIRYGDHYLFEAHPELETAPVRINFKSSKSQYNKERNFGPIGRYRIPFTPSYQSL
ncbi:MAG: staygreen family protein [Cellulosilyticaceae bacterium]